MINYSKFQPWVIWLLAAGYFFAEYFARVNPSISASQLMAYFGVGAFAIGNLSAFFYYPYILMQIPVGSILDRFGPGKVLTGMAFICGFSCFLFAYSQHLQLAEIARMLMGFSAAFAFVGTLKLATIWFASNRLGLLSGLTQGMGMLGAALGQGVFGIIVAFVGWRFSMNLIGIILVMLALLMFLLIKDKPTRTHSQIESIKILAGLKIVFKNPQSWLLALYAGLIYAPTAAFAELWGPSYLHQVYAINQKLAAFLVGLVFIGLVVGCPLLGWLSDKLRCRKPFMLASCFFSLILLLTILYGSFLTPVLLGILLFLYGVANGGVAISYAASGEINALPVSGLSIALTNMGSIAVGALFQPLIGFLLEQNWDGKKIAGVPIYSPENYHYALIVLPLCLVLAGLVLIFIRETLAASAKTELLVSEKA